MTGRRDPLEGLDDVPWSELHTAYGRAGEVPAQLRVLRDGTGAAERELAWARLTNALEHQDSVYASTAAAVPFLARLAETRIPEAAAVLRFLGHVLDSDNLDLLDEPGKATEPYALAGVTVRDAVLAHTPRFLSWVDEASTREERVGAIFLASRTAEHAAELIARVRRRLERADEPEELSACCLALGDLRAGARPEIAARLRELTDAARHPAVRLAAAMALVESGVVDLPESAALAAAGGLEENPVISAVTHASPWVLSYAAIGWCFAKLDPPDALLPATEALIGVALRAHPPSKEFPLRLLLRIHFPGRPELRPPDPLAFPPHTMTESQRALLGRLASEPDLWATSSEEDDPAVRYGAPATSIPRVLGDYRLPQDRRALCAYLWPGERHRWPPGVAETG